MLKKISARDFLNYSYCERIIYFMHVLHIPQETTKKEEKGKEKYEEFKLKSKRNKIIKEFPKLKKLYNVKVETEELITFVDVILFDDKKKEAFPLQIKYSYRPKKIYLTQRYQLLLEAYLIEKTFHYKVNYGFIKFLKSNEIVKIELKNKQIVLEVKKKIENLIKKEKIPNKTKYIKRCKDCCYRRLCLGN